MASSHRELILKQLTRYTLGRTVCTEDRRIVRVQTLSTQDKSTHASGCGPALCLKRDSGSPVHYSI
jgi:hypothetical protein